MTMTHDPIDDLRMPMPTAYRSHLNALEDESIHIMREVAAEFEKPCLLFSGGKDSIVMARLAEKAFWPGRILNSTLHYPEGLDGEVHDDGEIWATCLMRIWNTLGQHKTDTVVLEGLGLTTSSTNQDDAAQALMQAAHGLGFSAADQLTMFNEFTTTGYTVTIVPVELQSFSIN